MHTVDNENRRIGKFLRYKSNIRDENSKIINDDEAVIVDLSKAPSDAFALLCFIKVHDLEASLPLFETSELLHSSFGVEDWSNNIEIDRVGIAANFKFEDLIKPSESDELET